MQVPISNRTVLRSFMAGALVVLGAGACSRPDRAESGSDNTAVRTFEDTAMSRATQDVPGTGQDRMDDDTTARTSENTGTGAGAGDTAPARLQSDAPRAATASPPRKPETRSPSAESGAAGQRSTERDTAAHHESDSARVTEDTSETSLNPADTGAVETAGAAVTSDTTATDTATVAGYAEMARDTTSGADQIDTTGAAVRDDAGDTTLNAGRVRPIEDSTETMGQVTTDTNAAEAMVDSADAAIGARGDDTTGNAGRVRPVEDSTELQGNASEAGTLNPNDSTLNAGRVRPIEDSTETVGQVTTGDSANVAAISDSAEAAGDAAIAARGDDTTGNAGRIRPPEDSTELQGNTGEAASQSQGDTTGNAAIGAEVGDTTMNAGRVRPVEDSTEILGQVTTDTSGTVAVIDSAEVGAIAARGADTTGNAGRIRPPEDSTELQGNVNAAESASVNAADTADEAPVAETSDSEVAVEPADTQPAAAAAVGGTVTGADAVAMLSRQGSRCDVVDPETDEEVRWDMSSTPATLNPCGLGSMNLSKVETTGQR